MEYCENGDLLTYLNEEGFESEEQKKKIIFQSLDAVSYLHKRGMAHGDLKPENILLDSDHNVKLSNFGFSKTSEFAGDESKSGTLYYAAPELFVKGMFNTLKTDIWSIGITLYCMDLTPIIEWCETEYTPFNGIPFDDELDDPSKQAVMFNCALDLCNRFRSSLKPTFNAIATRINEITNEIVNVETNINNKFKEYISKYDLTRDDKIDVFAKIDNEHHVLYFELEDDVINGLIVFKTYAIDNTASQQRRFYIKIFDGAIPEYKGVNETITIEAPAGAGSTATNITIKPLARSEDDRVVYIPNAQLILDATEKLISIPFDSNYIINSTVVEQCTCTRQMIYQVSDLAYVQDIDALDKKINALAEVSHNNDVSMASIQETYTTVDEVNEALSNYALTTELAHAIELVKSELPTIPTDLIDEETLTTKLNDYALKSENEELKSKITALETENTTLKTLIEALRPNYQWQEFYQEFNERVEFMGNEIIGSYLFYNYYRTTSPNRLVINYSRVRNIDPTAEYLCILRTPTIAHYIRIDLETEIAYVNEIRESTAKFSGGNDNFTIIRSLGNITSDGSVVMHFDYVFKKTTS